MENENLNNFENTTEVNYEEDMTKKYMDRIKTLEKEIQTNYVPRSVNDKLLKENEMLFNTIQEGKSYETTSPEVPAKQRIEELANKLFGPGHEKLKDNELIEGLFEIRNLAKKEYGIDTGIPNGQKYQFDVNDLAAADRVEEGFKYCLDSADGDNAIFMREAVRLSNNRSW